MKKLIVLLFALLMMFGGCFNDKKEEVVPVPNVVQDGNLEKLKLLVGSYVQSKESIKKVAGTITEGLYIPATGELFEYSYYSFDLISQMISSNTVQPLLDKLKTNSAKTYIILDYNGFRALYWTDFTKLADFNGTKSKAASTLTDLRAGTVVQNNSPFEIIYADGTPVIKPTAPTNITATAISTTQISISWKDNANNEKGFKLYRSTDGNKYVYIQNAIISANITTYSDIGLSADTTYFYRVSAYNAAGESDVSIVYATAKTKEDTMTPQPKVITEKFSNKKSSLIFDSYSFEISVNDSSAKAIAFDPGYTQTGTLTTTSGAAMTTFKGVIRTDVGTTSVSISIKNATTTIAIKRNCTLVTSSSTTTGGATTSGGVSTSSGITAEWLLPAETPKLPMGMNMPSMNYYDTAIIFTDAMTTASEMIAYSNYDWDTKMISEIIRDQNGYPTFIPQTTSDGKSTKIRFLVNNYYKGKYRILYDGEGTFGAGAYLSNGKYYIDFTGEGGHKWIDLESSTKGNYVKNIRILPESYENSTTYPTFIPAFLEGLKPFHSLRFMDWVNTNGSKQVNWSDRVTKSYYTQGGIKGISFDYAIQLSNELNADLWICVPARASDDYIKQLARLCNTNLNPGLKIYLEYSNEIWNWMFDQAHYVVDNAPNAADSYVSSDLAALGAAGVNHPEKDAYMMARTFRLWDQELAGSSRKYIKLATGQHGWVDNSRRILEYLFNVAKIKCDALSVGGYFGFEEESHNNWLANPSTVTTDKIMNDTLGSLSKTSFLWTRETAKYAKQFGVDYIVYEGGQHMQPFNQSDWSYNPTLWKAQIDEKMYLLYRKNFAVHVEPEVNCKLFMAFSYIGSRESRYGSWGHLENLNQIGTNYRVTAPKYQALLDCNTVKP